VAQNFIKYADQIYNKLKENWFRTSLDDSEDSFSKKIRNAELMKIPYILIVGEKEESEWTVSVRVYKTKEQLTMDVNKFIEEKLEEVKNRK
jgi:threonyl-tRNA synthetase